MSACTRILGLEGTPEGVEDQGRLTRVAAVQFKTISTFQFYYLLFSCHVSMLLLFFLQPFTLFVLNIIMKLVGKNKSIKQKGNLVTISVLLVPICSVSNWDRLRPIQESSRSGGC